VELQSHASTQTKPQLNLDTVVCQAAEQLLAARQSQGQWDLYPHLGLHFLSQYYLCLQWLGLTDSDLQVTTLEEALCKTQLPDGSWYQVQDADIPEGDLNATIFNYWALKVLGSEKHADILAKAKKFILEKGGIEASSLFTKTFLALFGNFPWSRLTYVPYVVFWRKLPLNYKEFSQWVIPHLMAIAYLRHNRVAKNLGPLFQVEELWTAGAPAIRIQPRKPRLFLDLPLVKKILGEQQPMGSWGGYTVSTLLSVMALEHFRQADFIDPKVIETTMAKGIHFIDRLYVSGSPGSYKGCLMDGHYWDTLLIGNALMEAGIPREELNSTAHYILSSQQENGGFPYGFDFEYAPDVDDTAEAMMFLQNWPEHRARLNKSSDWLLSLQNHDGGWGAFDQNNMGGPILNFFSRKYRDSVELFDRSSADSTGHVLDALSLTGHNLENSPAVKRAIDYLKRAQDPETGAWEGRWAINYIFGTACAVVGLVKAGEVATEPYIMRAIGWLLSKQNRDGGFGESTRSYSDKSWAGRGSSTPTQTAWVLWTLNVAGLSHLPAAAKAVEYLMASYQPGRELPWHDHSVTGTGHPGLLYMNYPSYAAAFPLYALAQYRRLLRRRET